MAVGRSLSFPRRANVLAAVVAAILAVLVLAGWTFNVEMLKRIVPGLVAMNPMTAVSFLLASVSLAFVRQKPDPARDPWLVFATRACAFLIVSIGATRILAFAGAPDLRIDELLFASKLNLGFRVRNVMAPNTALNFFLVGSALLLLHSRRRRMSPFACIAALVCGFEAILAILGYTYGIGAFYKVQTYIPMALNTAIGFLVLAFGIMSCQAERGFLAAITSGNVGGVMTRRLLPAAILLPAIIGWLRIEAHRRGFVGSELGFALFAVTNMLVFGGLVTGTAFLLFKTDAARIKADRRLRRAHVQLEKRVAERTTQLSRANAELEVARVDLETRVRERTATLAESEARLHAILDHSNAVVFLKNLEGRYLLVNRQFAKLFGLSCEEILGKTAYELFSKEVADSSSADDRKVLATGGQLEFEDTAEQPDGTHTYISRKFPLLDPEGRCYAICGIATDITERARNEKAIKAAKEEADRANRAKSEFLSRMSHELRTPMNAILGFAQLLELDTLDADQHESVRHIIRGGRHLLDLINEVLDISRIEAGRLTLSAEAVELSEVLGESMDLVRPLASHRDLRLSTAPLCACYVLADRQRLKQILINLISNAIKYNRVGGSVTIAYADVGGRARIEIHDTGVGIPAGRIPQLFVPFERLGADRSTIEGTGLGLAVARRLVEAMNGAIGVESVLGEGSTFWIELPVTHSPLMQTDRVEIEPPSETVDPEGKHSVLYIEDNLSNLSLMEHVLQHRPAVELLSARTGSDGLRLVQERTPDLILLDLNLPDMHGREVLLQLQTDPAAAEIPIVIISADAMSAQKDRLLQAGAADYLTKPLNVKKFLETLDRTLDEAEKLDS
jgi:PAS domain S-box-containing protein